MPKNNFKLFDENKSNMMTDVEYNTNNQRLNGVQSGVASSQLQNKTLYQTALMCYALAQIMAANGYDANDADAVSTFVNNLSSSMIQKILDKATVSEVKLGSKVNKYISPDNFIDVLKVLAMGLYGESDPTSLTVGELGQIYLNTVTQRAFYCGAISGNKYTWHKIARITKKNISEVVTSSKNWKVPDGVTSVMVRAFGGGGGGGKVSNYCAAGGGGGNMNSGTFAVTPGSTISIVIGDGGIVGADGGDTKFGTLLTAAGGKSGTGTVGGSGGTGGGGCHRNNSYGAGGNGSYGGGGGGSAQSGTSSKVGGDGGRYGGGGGRGDTKSKGGTGGEYGGNGASSSSGVGTDEKIPAEDGTDTSTLDLEFIGEGKAGRNSSRGGGGGGGYGGNGGNGGGYSGGGGGGYGGNGGNGSYQAGGGGGGYGGNGKTPNSGDLSVRGGGGGGYGASNYGCGGDGNENGSSGVIIITYMGESVE